MTERKDDKDDSEWFTRQTPEAKRRMRELLEEHQRTKVVERLGSEPHRVQSSEIVPTEIWIIIDDFIGLKTRREVTLRSHLRIVCKYFRTWLPVFGDPLNPHPHEIHIPHSAMYLWISRWMRRVFTRTLLSTTLPPPPPPPHPQPTAPPSLPSFTDRIRHFFIGGRENVMPETEEETMRRPDPPTLIMLNNSQAGPQNHYIHVYSHGNPLCRICKLSGVVLHPTNDKYIIGTVFQATPETGFHIVHDYMRSKYFIAPAADHIGGVLVARIPLEPDLDRIASAARAVGQRTFKRLQFLRKPRGIRTPAEEEEFRKLNAQLIIRDVLTSL